VFISELCIFGSAKRTRHNNLINSTLIIVATGGFMPLTEAL